ncbi:peptide deformylase [candidate division WOR-1 bacterium RIFOXYA12_FULL_52_29]|uniref:Peptide deformylase n=1 Tax=candidate division WOR-1 bacterium RIFOXYC12_FULL_54_18 TaxID=1802584 RepID=A0A1F4T6E4_UNCSA|nr:MAG: peptide deformylase [candidate division WOR-1 bacterium RIFOXYA2_FULL_51_19]OGC17885.1 MAG: peptide deformylase [candidate division WOR-1 bacterium RIFOXYA12_FULL_52_29]OGC26741.1 MAG: peptide deformylase [candidate division WOR-1 bacterium RIFOXYB2_FULL_45_9]OGC28302.1 MAG: peptide deformylase [candidate division WOR-1 bacterium RIFOXYC12_FULL_54_18]OGC31242.1 MAG: peptide deformylase [candidate division WOR-1 bacterium RIFOXYB12_FULL_52_16]
MAILKFPNPVLRKKSRAVKKVTPEIVRLIDQMIEIMHAAPGVGLAAPQIGQSLQVIVVDVGTGPIALVNPRITKRSGLQCYIEGCLSLPGVEAPVERASKIIIKGLSRDGKLLEIEANGFLATVFQHEVDHLDGKVLIDRVKDPSLIKFVAKKEPKEELL